MRLSIDWRLSVLLTALAWVVMFAICTLDADAQERIWTYEDTYQAAAAYGWPVDCVFQHETLPTWNPYSVGQAGELGAAQLHPQGELIRFAWGDWTPSPQPGFRDPFDPYVAAAYVWWHYQTYGHLNPWTTHWGCGL